MDDRRSWTEWLLTWALRAVGAMLCSALLAVVMPTAWMAAIHEWLGLGAFPHAPLTEYLTRSLSLLYAAHGGCMIVASIDVRRLRPMVMYLGCVGIAFGLVMIAIDLAAPMPWYWTLLEGPPTATMSAITLYLAIRLKKEEAGAEEPR